MHVQCVRPNDESFVSGGAVPGVMAPALHIATGAWQLALATAASKLHACLLHIHTPLSDSCRKLRTSIRPPERACITIFRSASADTLTLRAPAVTSAHGHSRLYKA